MVVEKNMSKPSQRAKVNVVCHFSGKDTTHVACRNQQRTEIGQFQFDLTGESKRTILSSVNNTLQCECEKF